MVEVKRRDREHVGSLLRRFSERVKKSGVLVEARNAQYYTRRKSRRQRREDAIVRLRMRAEKEKLRKLGKLDE